MHNKHLSVIVFTVVFALAVAITVGAGVIDKRINAGIAAETSDVKDTNNNLENPDVTQNDDVGANNTKPGSSNINDILNQILGQLGSHETAFGQGMVGGKNVNKGGEKYELEGEAVTTIYETETTTNENDTTIVPDEETTVIVDTTTTDTTKEPEVITTPETTVSPETEPVTESVTDIVTEEITDTATDETVDVETTVGEEETTGEVEEDATEPVDNAQAEVTE